MDIKIEYMIEAYNLKFEKICTYCETLQIVKPVIEKFAQKILTTILMSLSVVFSVVWVGNKATDKIVDELKRGRENLKDSAKETGDKIKQFSNDISNTAKDLKSKEGQIWLIDKIRIMVKAMLSYMSKAGRFIVDHSGWENLSQEKKDRIQKLWSFNIKTLRLATQTSMAIGVFMAIIFLSYKLINVFKQKNADSVEKNLKQHSSHNLSLAKRTVKNRK